MDCREAFEKWALEVNPVSLDKVLQKKPSGEYLWSGTSIMWQTWQAAWIARYEADR